MKRPYKVSNRKQKSNFRIFLYLIIMLIAVTSAAVIAIKIYTMMLPPIRHLEDYKPNVVTQIFDADGETIKTFTAFTSEKASIKEVPEDLQLAVIATEDKNFYKHDGYDLLGLLRSCLANIQAGRLVQGASTITQQLARLLFLTNEKTYDRKIKEFILAARIEKSISKEKILEMYLNNVYLGSGAYGVAGAARVYFDKSLNELSLAEMALIAGLPQAPSVYSPFNDLEKAIKRRNQVLNRMYKMKYISNEALEQARKEKVKLNPLPSIYVYNKAPYFVDYVMKELEAIGFDELDISQGGYKIYTTLDTQSQRAANIAVLENLKAWGLSGKKNQAAVFSFSPMTGEIYTYVGGKDYSKSQYDRITSAIRPPGSSFKPIVYAAAVEKGYGPNDLLEDMPVTINKWSPRNYGSLYRGKIPMYAGLMISSNTIAVRLIEDIGIRSVISLAKTLGITTPLEHDYTIALGSNGVKLFDLTTAYGAFANGGLRITPYAVQKVETSRGKVVYQAARPKIVKAISYNTASIMTAMLKTVITSGTGKAANIGIPTAGKTGTTDDYRDAWFVGYTPDIVTGVWVGNDDNSVMGKLTGGTIPALIWKDVMKVSTAKFGNKEFDYPPVDIKFVKIPYGGTVNEIKAKEAEKENIVEDETTTGNQNTHEQIGLEAQKKTIPKGANRTTAPTFTDLIENNKPRATVTQPQKPIEMKNVQHPSIDVNNMVIPKINTAPIPGSNN